MKEDSNRFEIGVRVLREVGGEKYDAPLRSLDNIAPDLARFTVEFAYGDIMRLARPNIVVDINRIEELNYVRASDGGIVIGALARQRALQTENLIAERMPILQEAAYYIAHPQIRSRGTICGSIAHADPAAELPALALALDVEMTLTSAKAARTVGAETFFQSFFTTALEANEILTEVRFPAPPKDSACLRAPACALTSAARSSPK